MKIYVMSRTKKGESLMPKASRDFKALSAEMAVEYGKVLSDAGQLGKGYIQEDGVLVAYYGTMRHTWRIDEITC